MSAKSRQKYRYLKIENQRYKTAIALKCLDCQGYELSTTCFEDCYNCPLCPFSPKKGSTKSPIFSDLVNKMRKMINGEMVVDKDFWKNEFEKLKFGFEK